MDSTHPLDLLPSALFSPSKAAQQRAQAQDWHHVDTWLASKYQGRSVPIFERNEETLKAFLALVAANEKADEERELLWSVQKEALGELKGNVCTSNREEEEYAAEPLEGVCACFYSPKIHSAGLLELHLEFARVFHSQSSLCPTRHHRLTRLPDNFSIPNFKRSDPLHSDFHPHTRG